VAKNKRSPALFEVINRAQTQGYDPRLQIPQWWRSNSEAAEADKNLAPPSSHDGAADRQGTEVVEVSQGPSADEANARSDPSGREPPSRPVGWAAQASADLLTADEQERADRGPAWERPPSDQQTQEVFDEVAGDDEAVAGPSGGTSGASTGLPRVLDGRVVFSLDPAQMVIAVGGILLLVAVGFVVGNKVGYERARQGMQEQAVNSIEQARRMQPNGSVLSLGNQEVSAQSPVVRPTAKKTVPPARTLEPPSPKSVETSAPSGVIRQVGWNYLLIQHFRGADALEEAVKAERFILSQVPAEGGPPPVTVEPHPEGGYMLLSTVGYSSGDVAGKEAFQRFQQWVVNVGKLYRQRGGGYDFRDAYAMKLSRLPNTRRK